MKNKKCLRLLLCIFTLFFITSCGFLPTKVERIEHKPSPILCEGYSTPDSLNMLTVKFDTVEDKDGVFWLAMDSQAYENASINLANMLGYIRSQKAINKYLVDCIDNYNERLKENPGED